MAIRRSFNWRPPHLIASIRFSDTTGRTIRPMPPRHKLDPLQRGRLVRSATYASLIVALCTEDTSYMTGVVIDANGASYAA